MNVIVGLNGAGKSNFLAAICFVLGSDRYFKMSTDDRKALLHRGGSETVIAGYVELHMENMGDNVALGLPSEVVVRRTVGMKKDEYLLNNKRAELGDVINLFETIGFSRSNPYNIVLQGQVDALTAMSASERLELVKDIAGASLYDDKKEESLKLLEETVEKMNKVGEVIQSLQDRIDSLGEEKDELARFQQLDKRRRALEHRLRDLDLANVELHLSTLDSEHQAIIAASQDSFSNLMVLEDQLENAETNLRNSLSERDQLESQKAFALQEHSELVQRVGQLELEIRDLLGLQEGQDAAALKQKTAAASSSASMGMTPVAFISPSEIDSELAKLNKEIALKQKALETAKAAFDKAYADELKAKQVLEEKERRVKELYGKQGRIGQFKTKAERNKALKDEVAQLSGAIEHRRKQTSSLESDIAAFEVTVKRLEATINGRAKTQADLMQAVKERTELFEKSKKARDAFAEARKTTWKGQKELEEKIFKAKSELAHFQRQLHSSLPRELVLGLEEIGRMSLPAPHRVYGSLSELINVDELYLTAVEVTAGMALFHVLVDTDETASMVLKHLTARRAGRVTCIPLNKLNGKDLAADIPWKPEDRAAALSQYVNPVDAVFHPAIVQLMGKTAICEDLEIAKHHASQHTGLACVTLAGDQVSTKGALTGGYIDERASRLRSAFKVRDLVKEIKANEAELQEFNKKLDEQEERITREIKNMTDLERLRNESLYSFETFADSTRTSHRELLSAKEVLSKRIHSNSDNEAAIASLQASIDALEKEMGAELSHSFSQAESLELQQLNIDIDRLAHELTLATTNRAEVEAEKLLLESLLGSTLLPRQVDLEAHKASIALKAFTTKSSVSIETLQAELKTTREKLAAARVVEEEAELRLFQHRDTLRKIESEVQDTKTKLLEAQTNSSQIYQSLEKHFNTRSAALSKKEELLKRIREIGSLPSKESEDIADYSHSRCQRELLATKDQLAGFGNVNKKALDQFLSFSEEKDKFSQRREQMELEHAAIRDLISKLDMQKDDAIARTFRGVAKNFSLVFKDVCPDGEASLVMRVGKPLHSKQDHQSDSDSSDEEDLESEEDEDSIEGEKRQKKSKKSKERSQKPQAEQYIGIDMRVSFNKNTSGFKEGTAIRQLSGGQRTITSLSLIFAIQRCDPAPFYIFDEIDPALDDRFRNTIAAMVKEQAKRTQFLIVTHRPEMVRVAHKNYVVRFRNRVSVVEVEEVESALEVVAKAEKEAEKQTEAQIARQQQSRKRRKGDAKTDEDDEDEHAPFQMPSSTTKATKTAKASSSATRYQAPAPVAAAQGAASDSDDEDLVVRFDRREADDEPLPFVLPPADDELLGTPKSRPKRSRSQAD